MLNDTAPCYEDNKENIQTTRFDGEDSGDEMTNVRLKDDTPMRKVNPLVKSTALRAENLRKSADVRTVRPESSSSSNGSEKQRGGIFGSAKKSYLPSFMSAKKKTNNIAPEHE